MMFRIVSVFFGLRIIGRAIGDSPNHRVNHFFMKRRAVLLTVWCGCGWMLCKPTERDNCLLNFPLLDAKFPVAPL